MAGTLASAQGMKIACLCVTFNRPAQLAEAIESFLRQTYPARELVILDDAGQYAPSACDHLASVKLVTTRHRFRTLGEKRNACAALASPDCEAYAVWDDDDIYLPWHLEAMAAVFAAGHVWSLPAEVWIDRKTHLERKNTGGLFHGAWGFTREALLSVGGYPAMQSGQDQALAARFQRAGIMAVSPSELVTQTSQSSAVSAPVRPPQHQSAADDEGQPLATGDFPSLVAVPSYIYRWHTYPGARHLSALGKDGYQCRAQEPIVPVDRLTPRWSRDWLALPTRAPD